MARPLKQGLDYFPHDTDASMDDKIEAIEALHGLEGYAVFFKLCERIYRTHDGELDISDAETRKIYARNMHISLAKFNTIVESLVKRGLFDAELFQKTKRLSSGGIKKRRGRVINKRLLMSETYQQAKLQKPISDAEIDNRNSSETPQSREKKRKEEITTPTPSEEKNVFTLYEANFGALTPMIGDELQLLEKDYPFTWIEDAFKEAIKKEARNLKYVEAILKRWKTEGWGSKPSVNVHKENTPEDYGL